ncbi:MAG: excinuclease ABC subunit UvrA [Acidobacteriota bacterium]|nr:excinuclease ABC subunit UvrA [Acidobacteriota bacterium]MDH3522619.1 excinuclease ABC subunit UvrA [Acidobacteriota bacterium]
MTSPTAIEVRGARTHNLKNVSCRIPHGKLTVVTGPSGAGKSSLAFDTVFAEGQRRFVESMSTYARQFLDRVERPPLDELRGILPAVALEARNAVRNARSTVGTLTETHDVLRLLFTHLGEVSCPAGHGAARACTPQQAAEELVAGAAGAAFVLVAPVRRPRRGASQALAELVRQGFGRRLEGDEVVRLTSRATWPGDLDPLHLVLGRFRADEGSLTRVVDAVEEAYRLAAGRAVARGETTRHVSAGPGCPRCGLALRRPVPALFSFNSPLGACGECQGFGRVIGIDRDRVIPDPSRTLAERPFAPWNTPAYEKRYERLWTACAERGVPLDVPWRDLPPAVREWVWSGKGPFTSLERFFAWLEKRSYRVHMRVLLARFRAYDPCPACRGTRLRPEALSVTVQGRTLPSLTAESVESLRRWLASVAWGERQLEKAHHLIEQLTARVEVLHRVGLDYLTLDRQARTLSGGETQRIHLAASLGSGLTSTLYVLDEPTVGLHPRDSQRLLELLRDLARRGNTVLVVEHDRTLIEGADHVIDLGPAAGEMGGELLAEGPLAAILASDVSLTARYLRRPARDPRARRHLARHRREAGKRSLDVVLESRPRVRITGAREHNLAGFDVEFPLAALVGVSGVSGSGKSTLVENVLFGNYQRRLGVADAEPGECDGLDGLDGLAYVAHVDQYPLGRSSRSNPVTYLKAYDAIRKLFAATPAARRAGITPGHFSFNVDKGRCPACQGTGAQEIDMQFMAPVSVPCDSCLGRRFTRRVLDVRYRGLDIAETLELTVQQALLHFAGSRLLTRRLGKLADVGLGYLRLGQSTATLSGGEAQRLKLAGFLDRPATEGRRLFLFDEPTTGLHLSDIDRLCATLRRLVARRDGVVVVEHNLDLLAQVDWIVDLGPGGGVHGGRLLYSGPLGPFLDGVESPTADALRAHFGSAPPRVAPEPAVARMSG